MAYRRFRRFRGRVRRFASRGRRSFRRGGMAGIGIPFVAGAAAGYLAPRFHPMQDVAITALSVLPVRLPYGIKRVAQGYVLGMLVKGFIAPSSSGSLSQSDFA